MTETTTDQNVASEELAMLFRRTSRLMARAYHRQDHAPHAQFAVLNIINRQGPISRAELLEMLDVRSASLSEVLQKLERNDLIQRERNELDRRGFVLSATERGKKMAEQTSDEVPVAHTLFHCLSTAEQQQLRYILSKLADSLQVEQCDAEDPAMHHRCGHGRGRHTGRGGGKRGGGKRGPGRNGAGRNG